MDKVPFFSMLPFGGSGGPGGAGPSAPVARNGFNYDNRPVRDRFTSTLAGKDGKEPPGALYFGLFIAYFARENLSQTSLSCSPLPSAALLTRPWAYGYAFLVALVFLWGFIGAGTRSKDFGKLTSHESLRNPNMCPVGPGRRMLHEDDDFPVEEFTGRLMFWIFTSLASSVGFGYVLLYMFRTRPLALIRYAGFFQIGMLLVMAIANFAAGSVFGGIIFLVFAGLTAWGLRAWRPQLELCGRLFGVSGKALQDNLVLIPFVLLLKVASMVIFVPIIALMITAYMNGALKRYPAVTVRDGMCYSLARDPNTGATTEALTNCCYWQPDTWVSVYYVFASLAITWTTMNVFALRVYTIAGSVAQWYFAPQGTASYQGNVGRSFRHAIGPSLGSICEGGAILTVVETIRKAAESQRHENRDNICASLARMMLECVLSLIEFLTRFATIRISITGEAFWEGGRNATDLLKRNFLNSAGVWWIPGFVLGTLSFMCAISFGFIAGIASAVAYRKDSTRGLQAFLIGLVVFLVTLTIISFFASVMTNIIEATYYCYASDLDSHQVSHQEFHAVFQALPGPNGQAIGHPSTAPGYGGPAGPYAADTEAGRITQPPPVQGYPPTSGYPNAYPPTAQAAPYGYPTVAGGAAAQQGGKASNNQAVF